MLAPVDDILIATLNGGRCHFRRSAPGIRLGDTDRRLVAVQNELCCQFLLLFRAVPHDRADRTHVGLNHDPSRHTADFSHLLDDQNSMQKAIPLPTPFSWNGHAHKPGLGQLFNVVPRVLFRFVDIDSALGNDVLCERTRVIAGQVVRRSVETSICSLNHTVGFKTLAGRFIEAENFLKHLIGMLTQHRRRASIGHRRLGKFDRIANKAALPIGRGRMID